MKHFSLFSGIGGIDIAAEWAGFETVGQCEFADYPTKVLEKHWPDVPRWRDIRTLTKESFYERTGRTTVDLVSGGFPCQPFSVAGNKKGKEDDRYLWPEMLRVIRELTPRWVVGENVPGILRIAGRTVCEDLEREGYAVAVFNFEAAAVGARHRRDRCFFVANARSSRFRRPGDFCIIRNLQERAYRQGKTNFVEQSSEISADMANTNSEGLQRGCETRNSSGQRANFFKQSAGCCDGRKWWSIEPRVGRVAHGISNRSHRLKCLGNAVVPQQVYPILQAIAEMEASKC